MDLLPCLFVSHQFVVIGAQGFLGKPLGHIAGKKCLLDDARCGLFNPFLHQGVILQPVLAAQFPDQLAVDDLVHERRIDDLQRHAPIAFGQHASGQVDIGAVNFLTVDGGQNWVVPLLPAAVFIAKRRKNRQTHHHQQHPERLKETEIPRSHG